MKYEKSINHLIEQYMKGEATREELEDIFSLFEAPSEKLNLKNVIYDAWQKETGFDLQPEPEFLSEILDKVHKQIGIKNDIRQNHKKIRKIIRTVSKVAAILLIGILAGFFMHRLDVPNPVYYTSIAPKGSISQMILPDSTIVFLNAGSEIKYTINNRNRHRDVFLDGEAWFEVTKNKEKPFIVHTPFYNVKVHGTKFNVKAYKSEQEILTTLEEGSVEVVSGNLKIKENTFLKPGEQLAYNAKDNTLKISNVETRLFSSWKDNKLIFINMNLRELIVLLERKFGVDIEVADNIVLDYHYDGTIKDETILEVLDLLKETLPIRYKIDGQKVIIQNKK